MRANHTSHDDYNPNPPSPQVIATWLRRQYTEGEALDLIRLAALRWGWTWQLNMTGLLLLKPSAEPGTERGA